MEFENECPVCYEKMLCPFIIKCEHTSCYSCLVTQLDIVNSPKANCPLGCGHRYDFNEMVPFYDMISINDEKEMTRCVKDLDKRCKNLPKAFSHKKDEEGKYFFYVRFNTEEYEWINFLDFKKRGVPLLIIFEYFDNESMKQKIEILKRQEELDEDEENEEHEE